MSATNSLQRSASARMRRLPENKSVQQWTFEEATGVIESCILDGPTREGFDQNVAYVVDRDHWQRGTPWVGPRGTTETEAIVLDAVEPQFTPVDETNACLDRFTDALLERIPTLNFVPRQPVERGSDEEKALQERAKSVVERVQRWAQRRKLWDVVRESVKRSRWACWGTLREWIPESRLTRVELLPENAEEGATPTVEFDFPSGKTLDEALDAIFVTAPEPDQCVVYEDPETRERVAIFMYCFDDREYVELWWVDRATQRTHVRTLTSGDEPIEHDFDLGGRLPIVQLDGELLITESVRRQQARLNFFESLMVRVGETAGFPERYTANAQPTGLWMTTAPTDGPALSTTAQDGTTWYLHPTPRTLGASITTDLVGVQDDILDENGILRGKKTLTPGVTFREPTDPEYAIKACRHAKAAIREECHQGHIGMDGEATATGWSRVQARAGFVTDVNNSRESLQLMLEEFFEVVLAKAGLMSGELGDFLSVFRAAVSVHVAPGPVDPEERNAINLQVEKGLLSIETALTMLGIEDVQAELHRLRNEPEAQLAILTKQFQLVAVIMGAGLQLTTACEIAKIPDEHLALIKRDVELAAKSEEDDDDTQPEAQRRTPARRAA